MNQFRASLRTPPANMAAHPTPVAPGAKRPVAAATTRSRTVPPSQDTTRAPTPATSLAVPPTPPTSQGTIARKRPNALTRPEDVSAPRKEETAYIRTISSASSTKSTTPILGRKSTPVRPTTESTGSMKAVRPTTPSPVTATRIPETKTPTAYTPPAATTPRASRLPLRATPSKTSTGSRTSTGTIDSPTRTVRVVTMKPVTMKARMTRTPPPSPTPLSASTITTTTTTTPPLTPRPPVVIMKPKARITPTSSTSTQSARSTIKDLSNVSVPMSIISGTLVPPGTIAKKRSSSLREPIAKAGKVFECEEQDGPCSRESCAAIPTKSKYNDIKFAKSPTPESRESVMSAPPTSNRTNVGKTNSKTIILELELPNKATSIATVGTKKGSNQTSKVVSTVSSPTASPLASPTSLKDPANAIISSSSLLTKKRLGAATSESGADQKKSTSNDHDSSTVLSKKDSQSEECMAKAKNQAQAIHNLAEKLKSHPPKSAPTSKERTLVDRQLLNEKLTDQGLKTQRVSISQDHLMLKQQQQQQMKLQQQQQRHETQSLGKSTKPQSILERRPSKRSSSKISIDQKIKVYPSAPKDENGNKQHSRRSSLSLVDEPVLKIQSKQSSLTINEEGKQKVGGKKLTPTGSPTKISQTKVLKNSTLGKKTVLRDKVKGDHINDSKSKTQVDSELDDRQEKENVRSFVLVVDEPILKEKLINLVKEEDISDQKLAYEQKKLEIEKREEALQQKLNFILKEQKRAIEEKSAVDEETLSEVDQAIIASLETFGDDKERSIDTQTLSSFNTSSESSTLQSANPLEKLLALSSGSHFNVESELDVTGVPSIPVSVATQVYSGKESKVSDAESFEPEKPSEMSFGSQPENVSSDKIPAFQGTLRNGTSEISIGIKSLVDSIETERQSLLSDSDGRDELSSVGKFSNMCGEYHKGMSELSLADKTLFESVEADRDSTLSYESDTQYEFSMFSDLHKEPLDLTAGYKRNLESSCDNDMNVMTQLECVKNLLNDQTHGQLSIFEDLTSDDLSIGTGSGQQSPNRLSVAKDSIEKLQIVKGKIGYDKTCLKETILTSDKTNDESLSANKLPETKLLTKSLPFTKDDGNAHKLSEKSLKSPESVPATPKGSVKSLQMKKSILSPVLGGSPRGTSPVGSAELKTSVSSTTTTISSSKMQGRTSLSPQTEDKLSRISPTFNKTLSLSPTSQSKMSRTSIRSLSPLGSKLSPTHARSGSPLSSRPLSPTTEGKLLPLKALSPSALIQGDKHLAKTSTTYSDTLSLRTVSPSFGVKTKTLKTESSTIVSESIKEMSAPTSITEPSESKPTPTIRSQTLIADHPSKAPETVKETSKLIPIVRNVCLTSESLTASELTKQTPEPIAMIRKQSSTPETITESLSTAVDSVKEMSSTLRTKSSTIKEDPSTSSNMLNTKEMGTSPSPTMITDYYSTKKQDLIINSSKLSTPTTLEDEKLLSKSVTKISTTGAEKATMSHGSQTAASPANLPKLSQSSVESESITSFQFQGEKSSIEGNSSDTSFGDNQISSLLLSAIVKDTISSPLIRKGRNDLPIEVKDLSDTSSISTTETTPYESSEITVISYVKSTHDVHAKGEADIFKLANTFAAKRSIADSIKKTILQIPSAAEMEEEISNIQKENLHNNSLNDEQDSLNLGRQKYNAFTPVLSKETCKIERPLVSDESAATCSKSKIAVAQTLSEMASGKLSSFMKESDILSSDQDNKTMKSADQKTAPINLEQNMSPVMFSPSKERLLAQANKIPFSIRDPQVLCMETPGTWFPSGVFDDKIAAAYFKMTQCSKYIKETSLLENQDTTSVSIDSQHDSSSFTTETDESLLSKNIFPLRTMEKDSISFFGKEKISETDDAYSESSAETPSLYSDTDTVTEDSTGLIRKEIKMLSKKHKHGSKASSNASSGSRDSSTKTSIASSHLSKTTDSSGVKEFKEVIAVTSPETVLDEELLDLQPHPLSPDSEVVMSILMPSASFIQHRGNIQLQPCKARQDHQKEAFIDLAIDSQQRKNQKVAGMEAASESMSVLSNIMPTNWQRNFSGVSVESKKVFQRENVPCEEPSVRPKVPQSRSPADSMGIAQLSEKLSLASLSPSFAPRNTVQQGDAIVLEPFQKSASPVGFRDVVQPSTKLSLSTLARNVVSKHRVHEGDDYTSGQESEEVSASNLTATGSSKMTFKQADAVTVSEASSGQISDLPIDTLSLSATMQQNDNLSTSEHTFIHPSEMAIALKSIIASLPGSIGSKDISQKNDALSNFSVFQPFQASETSEENTIATSISDMSEEKTVATSLSEVSEEKTTRYSSKRSETINALKDTLDSTATILSQYKEKVQHLSTSIPSSAVTLKSGNEDMTVPSSICSLSNLDVVKDAFSSSSTPVDFNVNVVKTFIEIPKLEADKNHKICDTLTGLRSKATIDESSASGMSDSLSSCTSTSITGNLAQETSTQIQKLSDNEASKAFEVFGMESSPDARMSDTTVTSLSIGSIPFREKLSDESTISKVNREPSSICSLSDSLRSAISSEKSLRDRLPGKASLRSTYKHRTETSTDSSDDTITSRLTLESALKIDEEIKADLNESENVDDDTQRGGNSKISHELEKHLGETVDIIPFSTDQQDAQVLKAASTLSPPEKLLDSSYFETVPVFSPPMAKSLEETYFIKERDSAKIPTGHSPPTVSPSEDTHFITAARAPSLITPKTSNISPPATEKITEEIEFEKPSRLPSVATPRPSEDLKHKKMFEGTSFIRIARVPSPITPKESEVKHFVTPNNSEDSNFVTIKTSQNTVESSISPPTARQSDVKSEGFSLPAVKLSNDSVKFSKMSSATSAKTAVDNDFMPAMKETLPGTTNNLEDFTLPSDFTVVSRLPSPSLKLGDGNSKLNSKLSSSTYEGNDFIPISRVHSPPTKGPSEDARFVPAAKVSSPTTPKLSEEAIKLNLKMSSEIRQSKDAKTLNKETSSLLQTIIRSPEDTSSGINLRMPSQPTDLELPVAEPVHDIASNVSSVKTLWSDDTDKDSVQSVATLYNTNSQLLSNQSKLSDDTAFHKVNKTTPPTLQQSEDLDLSSTSTIKPLSSNESTITKLSRIQSLPTARPSEDGATRKVSRGPSPLLTKLPENSTNVNDQLDFVSRRLEPGLSLSSQLTMNQNSIGQIYHESSDLNKNQPTISFPAIRLADDITGNLLQPSTNPSDDVSKKLSRGLSPVVVKFPEHESSPRSPPFSEQPNIKLIPGINLENQPSIFVNTSQKDSNSSANLSEWLVGMDIGSSLDSTPQQHFSSKTITSIMTELLPNKLGVEAFGSRSQILDAKQSSVTGLQQDSTVLPKRDEILKIFSVALSLGKLTPELRNVLFAISKRAASEKKYNTTHDLIEGINMSPTSSCTHDMLPPRKQKPLQQQQKEVLSKLSKALVSGKVSQELHNTLSELCVGEKTKVEQEALYTLSGLLSPSILSSSTSSLLAAAELTTMTSFSPSTDSIEFDTNGTKLNDDSSRPNFETLLTIGSYPKRNSPNHLIGSSAIQQSAKSPPIGLQLVSPQMSDYSSDVSFLNQFITTTESDLTDEKMSEMDFTDKQSKPSTLSVRDDSSKRKQKLKQSSLSLGEEPLPPNIKPTSWSVGEIMNRHLIRDKDVELKTTKFIKDVPDVVGSKTFFQEDTSSDDILAVYEGLSPGNAVLERKSSSADERPASVVTLGKVGGEAIMVDDLAGSNSIKINPSNDKAPHFGEILNDAAFLSQLVTSIEKQQRMENMSVNVISEDPESLVLRSSDSCYDKTSNLMAAIDSVTMKPFQKWRSVGKQLRSDDDSSSLETDLFSPKDEKSNSTLIKSSSTNDATDNEVNEDVTSWSRITAEAVDSLSVSNNAWCSRFQKQSDILRHGESGFHETSINYPIHSNEETGQDEAMPINERSTFMLDASEWKGGNLNQAVNTFAPFYLNLNEQTPSQFSTSFVQQQYVNESITIVPTNQAEMIINGQQFSSEQYSASTNEQPQFVIGIPYTHSYANERAHHSDGQNQMLGPTGQHFLSESKIVYSPHIGCNVAYQRSNLPAAASTLPVHNSPQSSPAVRPLDRKIPQSTPAVTKLRADATPFVQSNKANSTLTTPVFTSQYQQDQSQFANASAAAYLHQNSGPKIASLPGSVQYQQGFDNAMFLSGRLDQLSYPYDRNYISDQMPYDDSINNMNWQFQVNGNRKLNLNDSSEMIPEPVADVPKPDPCSHWSSGETRTQSYDMGKSIDHRNLMSNVSQVNSNVEGVLSESREDSDIDSALPVEHFFSIVDVTLTPSFIPNRVSSRLISMEDNNVDILNRPLTPGPYVSQNESLDSQLDATEIPPPRNEHLFPTLKEAGGIAVSSALTLGKEFNGVGVGNLLKDQRMIQQQEKEMHFNNSKLSIVVSSAAEAEGNKLMSPFNIDIVSLPAEAPWSSVVSSEDYSRGSKMSSSEQQFMQNIKDWSEMDEIDRISAEEFYPRQDMMTHDNLRSISNWNDKLTRMSAEDFFQHRMIRHKIEDIQMDNDNADLMREESRMSAEDFFQMCNGKHGGQWQRPESDRRFSHMSDQWPPSAQFVQNMGSSYIPNQFSEHFYPKNIPSGRPQFFSKDQNLHLHRYQDGEQFYPKNETTTMDDANSYMNSISLSSQSAGHMNQFCAEYYIQQENGQYYNVHGQNFIHNKPDQYSVSSPQMCMSHNEGTGLPSNLISNKQGKIFHSSGITIEPDIDKYQNSTSTSGQANSEAGMRSFSNNLNNSKFKKTSLDQQIFGSINMSNFGSSADQLTKSSQGIVNSLTGECFTTDFPNLGIDNGTMPGSDLLAKVNNLLLDNELKKIKSISLESRLSREPLSVIPEETNRLSAEDFYRSKEKWKTEQAHKYDLDAAAVFVTPQQSDSFVPITKTMDDEFAIEIPSMLGSAGQISSVEVEETETQTQCVLIISIPEELVPETDFEIKKRLIEERLARLMEVELATLMAPPGPDSLMVVAESSVVELLNRYRELNSQQSLLEISKSAMQSPNLSLTGMNEVSSGDEEAMITVVAAANLQHSAAYRLEKFLESLSQPPVDSYINIQNTLEGTPSAGDLLDFELVDSTVEGSYASSLPADMLVYRRQDEWSQTGDLSNSAAVEIADEISSQEYLEDIMEESGECSSLEASMQETLNDDLLRNDEMEFDMDMDSIKKDENGHGDMTNYDEEEDDEDTSLTALTVYKGRVSPSLIESSESGNLSDSESKTEKLLRDTTLDGITPSENDLLTTEKPVEVDDIGRPSEQQLVIHQADQNPFDKWKNNQSSHVTGFCLVEQPALLSRERISTTIRKRLSEHDMKSVDPKNLMHLLVSTMDWPEESPIPKPRRNPKESSGDTNRHTPVPSPRKFKMEESIKNDIGRFGQIGIMGNSEQNNFKKDLLRYNYVGKDRQHVNKKKDQDKRKSPILYLRLPKGLVSDLPPLPPSPPTSSPTTVSPRSPHTSPRSPNTSSRTQTTSPRTPNISPRTPNTSPRTPNTSPRTPNTSPRTPNLSPRTLNTSPRTSNVPNTSPRSQNSTPRSVNTTPRTPKTPKTLNTSPQSPIVSPSTITDLQPVASPRNSVIKQLNVTDEDVVGKITIDVVDKETSNIDKENSDVDKENSDIDDKETGDVDKEISDVDKENSDVDDKETSDIVKQETIVVVDKETSVVVEKETSVFVDKQTSIVVNKQRNVNTAVVDKQCTVSTKDKKKKFRRSPSPLPRRRHTSPLLRSSRSPSPVPRQKLQMKEFEKEIPLHSAVRSRSTTPELDKCKENWSPTPLPRHSPKQIDIKVSPKSSKTDVLHNKIKKSTVNEDFSVDKILLEESGVTDLTRKPSLTSVETDQSDEKEKDEKENEDENEIDNEIDDIDIDISVPEPQESSPFLVDAVASPPSSPSPPLPLIKTLETIPEVSSQTELPLKRAPVKKLAPLKLTKEHLLSPKFLLELLTPPSMLHAKSPPITPIAKTKQWRVPSPLPLSWLLPQSLPYRQLGIPHLNHLSSLPLTQVEPTLIKATVTPIPEPPEEWLPPRLTLPSLHRPVQRSLPHANERTSSEESISSWHPPSPTPLPEGAVTPAPLAMEGRVEKGVEESGSSTIELPPPSSPPFTARMQSPLFSLPFTPSPPITSSPPTTINKFDSSARRSNSFHRSTYLRPPSPRPPDVQKSSQPFQMYNGRQTNSQTKCTDQRRMKQSANSEIEEVSFDDMPVDSCDSTLRSRWSPRHHSHIRPSKISAQRSASPRAHYQKPLPSPARAEYSAMPQTQHQQILHSHSPPQYHQRYPPSPNRIIDQWFPSQQEQEQFSQYPLSPYPYAVHQEQYSQGATPYAVDDLPPIPPVAVAKRVQSPYLLRTPSPRPLSPRMPSSRHYLPPRHLPRSASPTRAVHRSPTRSMGHWPMSREMISSSSRDITSCPLQTPLQLHGVNKLYTLVIEDESGAESDESDEAVHDAINHHIMDHQVIISEPGLSEEEDADAIANALHPEDGYPTYSMYRQYERAKRESPAYHQPMSPFHLQSAIAMSDHIMCSPRNSYDMNWIPDNMAVADPYQDGGVETVNSDSDDELMEGQEDETMEVPYYYYHPPHRVLNTDMQQEIFNECKLQSDLSSWPYNTAPSSSNQSLQTASERWHPRDHHSTLEAYEADSTSYLFHDARGECTTSIERDEEELTRCVGHHPDATSHAYQQSSFDLSLIRKSPQQFYDLVRPGAGTESRDISRLCSNNVNVCKETIILPQCLKDFKSSSVLPCEVSCDDQSNQTDPMLQQLAAPHFRDVTADLIIKVGARVFRAHRFILAHHSGYFYNLLKERQGKLFVEVVLHDITAEAFGSLYEWMYTKQLYICFQNLLDVWHAAQVLDVADYLNEMKNKPEDLLNLYFQLRKTGQKLMTFQILHVISMIYSRLCATSLFLNLDFEGLKFLLTCDNLNIKSEKDVFDSAIFWLKCNIETRREFILELMKCIRFGYMTEAELFDTIFNENSVDIMSYPECRLMVLDGFLSNSSQTMGNMAQFPHLFAVPKRGDQTKTDYSSQCYSFTKDNVHLTSINNTRTRLLSPPPTYCNFEPKTCECVKSPQQTWPKLPPLIPFSTIVPVENAEKINKSDKKFICAKWWTKIREATKPEQTSTNSTVVQAERTNPTKTDQPPCTRSSSPYPSQRSSCCSPNPNSIHCRCASPYQTKSIFCPNSPSSCSLKASTPGCQSPVQDNSWMVSWKNSTRTSAEGDYLKIMVGMHDCNTKNDESIFRKSDTNDKRYEGVVKTCDINDKRYEGTVKTCDINDKRYEGTVKTCDINGKRYEGTVKPCDINDKRYKGTVKPCDINDKRYEGIVKPCDINDKRYEGTVKTCDINDKRYEGTVKACDISDKRCERNEYTKIQTPVILILGGLNPLESWTNSIAGKHVYQFTSKLVSGKREGKWKKIFSELPSPRHHAVAAVSNEFIFLSGGCCPTRSRDGRHIEALNSLWRFNIKCKKWEKMADMLHSRIHHGFVALEKILVALGGQDETGRLLSSVEIYNIKQDKWKNGTPMCTPRMGMGTTTFHKFIWVCGGMSIKGKEKSPVITKVVECYDALTDRWCTMNPLRFPRCFGTLVECGGFLHLVGGVTRVSARKDGVISSVASVDIHDYVTDEWSFKAALQVPRHSAAAAVLDYHLYVIGGITSLEACALDCVECFNDIKGCWDKTSVHLPLPLSGVSCVVLNIELEDE